MKKNQRLYDIFIPCSLFVLINTIEILKTVIFGRHISNKHQFVNNSH